MIPTLIGWRLPKNCQSKILQINLKKSKKFNCNVFSGEWKVFTGNELGALLGWWTFHTAQKRHENAPLNNCYMLASTVSSMILKTMAKEEGFNFIETLTGFKWMGKITV